MSRFTAAFYHLSISFAVFVVLAYLVVFVWYPDFFYTTDGGWEGMRIIIAVDLVLGPVLTMVVFKAGKPGLKFDLAAIGIFQSICLAAGTYVVYSERPLYFIYYDDRFYSASADTFTRYGQPIPDPLDHSDRTPAMVFVEVPDDPIEEADFRAELYRSGIPFWLYTRSYRPLQDHMDTVLEESFPVETIRERDENGELDSFLAKHGGTTVDYAFYPIQSRYENPFIAVRRSDKSFAGILQIPAPYAAAEDVAIAE